MSSSGLACAGRPPSFIDEKHRRSPSNGKVAEIARRLFCLAL
jgi:hypothetical protein